MVGIITLFLECLLSARSGERRSIFARGGWVYDPYRGLEGLPEALMYKLGVWINRVKDCTASGCARKFGHGDTLGTTQVN